MPAHTLRLAMFTRCRSTTLRMGQDQLQAAIAWQYCQRSAQWALGQQTGNRMADGILWALSNEPLGMTRSEIRKISLVEIVPT